MMMMTPKGPLIFLELWNKMDIKKSQMSPCYIFIYFLFFFRKFFDKTEGSPVQFFSHFATNLSFKKVRRVPLFAIFKTLRFLSLRYSADFDRSRLV